MGKKRIIVGCDGTWLNSDNGVQLQSYAPWDDSANEVGTLVTPSNVTRMCRALQPQTPPSSANESEAEQRPLQIVDYEPGIASAQNWWDHYFNGGTGQSIGENVCSGYRAISANWIPGDEIFLIGFSRGSFIARSIAAMIRDVGLLNKTGMESFYGIFQDWEKHNIPGYKQKLFTDKNFDMPSGAYSTYARALNEAGWTTLDVSIKAIACFDTVGSLGIPAIGWFRPSNIAAYAFVDTEVLSNAEHCFQALAVDEIRTPFSPTLWELPKDRDPASGALKQCWFPGEHGNIGGSTDDAELPNISLAWMTEQLKGMLDFDQEYLKYCIGINKQYYVDHPPQRAWGMGLIPNPVSGLEWLAGTTPRTPKQYYKHNSNTGVQEKTRLRNTCEKVHPAVRVRLAMKGKGFDDKVAYQPHALGDWNLVKGEGDQSDPLAKGWYWEHKKDFDPDTGKKLVLLEDVMAGKEVMLFEETRV